MAGVYIAIGAFLLVVLIFEVRAHGRRKMTEMFEFLRWLEEQEARRSDDHQDAA